MLNARAAHESYAASGHDRIAFRTVVSHSGAVAQSPWGKRNTISFSKTLAIPMEEDCQMKGHGVSEQYQPLARGHGTSWSRYHRCLAESHDLPALSRLHPFRPVDVRLPHQHAVRPAVDLGPTSSERTQHRHESDVRCFCGCLNRSGTDSGKGLS